MDSFWILKGPGEKKCLFIKLTTTFWKTKIHNRVFWVMKYFWEKLKKLICYSEWLICCIYSNWAWEKKNLGFLTMVFSTNTQWESSLLKRWTEVTSQHRYQATILQNIWSLTAQWQNSSVHKKPIKAAPRSNEDVSRKALFRTWKLFPLGTIQNPRCLLAWNLTNIKRRFSPLCPCLLSLLRAVPSKWGLPFKST